MPRETVIKCSSCGDAKNSLKNHWVIGEQQLSFDPGVQEWVQLSRWTEELSHDLAKEINAGEAFEVCSKPACLRSAVEKMLFS